jgi:hypothetical protein
MEKITPIERVPQLDSPDEVTPIDRIDRGDQRIGDRPKKDDSLRGQPGGEFISPYMHRGRMDPSRQRREDTEQKDELGDLTQHKRDLDEQFRKLSEQRRAIDDQINEIRNRDTRINPYNVNSHVRETVKSIIADLRNMEQSPWSGQLSTQRGYSPLHTLFNDQFSVSEEEEPENELLLDD